MIGQEKQVFWAQFHPGLLKEGVRELQAHFKRLVAKTVDPIVVQEIQ